MWKIRWRNLINFCLKKTKKIDIIEAIETDQDMVIDIDDQDLDLLLLIVDILGHLQMLTGKYIFLSSPKFYLGELLQMEIQTFIQTFSVTSFLLGSQKISLYPC